MQSTNFSRSAPRPRDSQVQPKYPGIAAAIFAVSTALSCAGPPAQAPTSSPIPMTSQTAAVPSPEFAPTTLVVPLKAEQPPQNEEASAPPAARPTNGNRQTRRGPPTFPEDKEPLPMMTCGGSCPPSYQLGAYGKDEEQIKARIRYCLSASDGPIDAEGVMVVHVDINGKGRTREVRVETARLRGNLGVSLVQCISGLVQTARFHAEGDYARQHDIEQELKP